VLKREITMPSGRKQLEIDWKRVDKLLEVQCSGTEIAAALGMHPDTLYNAVKREFNSDFSAYSQVKRESGKRLLKAKQFEVALEGDKTMLVWLGKQYLDQSDRQNVTHEGPISIRIVEDSTLDE
jgi:IS30 family transposase